MAGKLYLIPTTLGDSPHERSFPDYNNTIVKGLKHFVVEELRTARRFLKKVDRSIDIDALTIDILNEHTDGVEVAEMLSYALKGDDVGVVSEAGCPAVADPGADIVSVAHQKGIEVIPLVGPSSILMSLMASGFNGQNFAFIGYLPIKPNEKAKRIKQIESRVYGENQTQIFIETPYRNNQLMESLTKQLSPNTRICVAADITLEDEFIVTKTAADWKKSMPSLHKRPTIFLIYK
ncbi:MAG: SAM-dependent methyltransferase [Bacteroidales bacterium]|jgi:16S rRNA (cytidine1402-2'-O)-methyltransferase|nr:SAM-dependent methyltransferase [Bacteroidales bacterium]